MNTTYYDRLTDAERTSLTLRVLEAEMDVAHKASVFGVRWKGDAFGVYRTPKARNLVVFDETGEYVLTVTDDVRDAMHEKEVA